MRIAPLFAPLLCVALLGCGSIHDAGVTAPAARSDGMEASGSTSNAAVDLATSHPELFACDGSDDECVAIPQAGCISNGIQEAVHRDQVQAYYEAHKALVAGKGPRGGGCPLIYINDNRVPRCNDATHRCELAYPIAPKS